MRKLKGISKNAMNIGMFSKAYAIVNVGQLDKFAPNTVVTPDLLLETRVIRELRDGLRVLGVGELTKPFTVHAHHFSSSAAENTRGRGEHGGSIVPVHDTNWRDSINQLGEALKVPDLRRRLLFVAGMFGCFIVGLHVPAPFVNPKAVDQLMGQGAFGLIDMMSGGALRRLSILALGIVPYINASIIMQLLGIAVPQIQRLQKEGESGRKIISTYTRVGTVVLSVVQGAGFSVFLYVRGAVDSPYHN